MTTGPAANDADDERDEPADPGAAEPSVAPAEPGAAEPGAAEPSPPPPDERGLPVVTTDSRNLAVMAHLSALVAFVSIPSFVGPLVVWLLKRDDPFVEDQAREALNFNLSILIYAAAALALTILTVGLALLVVIPAAVVAVLAWLVLVIVAAVRAADGVPYRYPVTLRLIR